MTETVESKIKSESTGDLINIQNFLTSISMGSETLSVFDLTMKLTFELVHRPDAKEYMRALTALLGSDLPADRLATLNKHCNL